MKSRGLILWSLFAGILAILLYVSFQENPQEAAARQHLNDLLGQANTDEPLSETQAPFRLPEVDQSFFGFPMPATDIKVEETARSYVLRIPLASAEDSSSVKLDVTPHRIQVSGQTGSKTEGQSFSSSFMQAFSTNQEVIPDQVHRSMEQNGKQTELVITIPKKSGGSTRTESNFPDFGSGFNDNDSIQRPIEEEESDPAVESPSVNKGNPLDTSSNRVI